jgi:hypothetical protein
MSPVRTTTVDLGDIIGFSPVHIPRLVTWGGIGEILAGVDFRVGPWYCDQVFAPPSRHLNPLLMVDSHSPL